MSSVGATHSPRGKVGNKKRRKKWETYLKKKLGNTVNQQTGGKRGDTEKHLFGTWRG